MDKKVAPSVMSAELKEWQDKYEDAYMKYDSVIQEIQDNREAYMGTRKIKTPTGQNADKQTNTTRKVCFELVETQVDTNIPMPKVISTEGYEEEAMTVEMYLKNEITRLPIYEINDEHGRNTPTDGAGIFYIQWDNTYATRNVSGRVSVSNLDTTQLIPQPGVYKIEDMDYIFIVFEETRRKIHEKYGVWVENEDGEYSINDDLLKHVFCFYKNDDNEIGLFSYVGDTIVQDYDSYFARQIKVCTKCGLDKEPSTDKCSCGNDKFKYEKREMEKMTIQVPSVDPLTGEQTQVDKEIEVPYYVPNFFPVVIRKNISDANSFLGLSDVSFIKDQQNDLSIFMAKTREKLLKGGSIVTVPKAINFKANDDELKIVQVENPAQMAMIEVKNIQPDTSKDLNMLEMNYTIARQTIGITDSFQGRQDTTATSGKAKEIAANQAAGRLSSKRVMKEASYSKLYEYMFKFLLAYADEPRIYNQPDEQGEMIYKIFDKKDFIMIDANDEFYYNDDFVFTTDVSSTLSNNREAMWQETRMNFTSGSYGPPNEIGTLVMFWQMMNSLHYPGARQALKYLEVRKQEQEMQRQQEMLAAEIQRSNVEQMMTNGKMKELEMGNQISQLKSQATEQGKPTVGDL